MAQMILEVPAPCDYDRELVKRNDCVVIKAYDNEREKEEIIQNEGEGK